MIEKIKYEGLPNCYRIFNELIELIVTTDVGPRIVSFGFVGQQNEFISVINPWGVAGHRLWHAPEQPIRTYVPDNKPIAIEQYDSLIRLTQPTEVATGIQKEIDLPLSPNENHISVIHRLYNRGIWPVELAPWGISVMAQGGRAIVPLPLRRSYSESDLVPTSSIAIWDYSDLTDPRLKMGRQYIMIQQDNGSSQSLKLGVMDIDGWAAYYNNGHLFVVSFEYKKDHCYPDLGSSIEVSCNKAVLEIEVLAPLSLLQPNTSVEYTENWFLFREVNEPLTEADIKENIIPLISRHVLLK